MQVRNMTGRSGKPVPNQFIITDEGRGALGNFLKREIFQSYESIIAERITWPDETTIILDSTYWNYSVTTSKYLAQFLGVDSKTIKARVKDGTYKLSNLN
jgi:hypothetical protein